MKSPVIVTILITLKKLFNFVNRQYIRRRHTNAAMAVVLFIPLLIFSCFSAEKALAAPFMFGVTIDDPWGDKDQIRDALASHAIKPMTRIVFDNDVAAAEYHDPDNDVVGNIKNVSFVMGEILDSSAMEKYSVKKYLDRTKEYLDEFGDIVDIWEIGNEVNGEWLGSISDVIEKIEGAYDLVQEWEVTNGRNLTTALNLYYNKSCYDDNLKHEMFTWVNNANLSAEMKNGLDYVLFSYYEDDCNDVVHTEAEWQLVFDELHAIFPSSKLGFGEVGTENLAKKAEYMHRYYELDIKGDYFIGGYFWWWYKQDCVPKTTELWDTLNTIITQKRNRARAFLIPIFKLLLLPNR